MPSTGASSRPVVVGSALGVAGATAWLLWHPPVADLAAQQARARLADEHGFAPYAVEWFGGFDLPTYSVWVPWLMGRTSVFAVGAVATVLLAALAGWLFASTRRPRLGSALFALAAVSNLYSGRVTFAVGAAVAVTALLAVVRVRGPGGVALASLLAAASATASPVAALLLALTVTAVALTQGDSATRVRCVACLLGALLPLAALAWLVPASGYQPYVRSSALLAFLVSLGVMLAPVARTVRVTAALSAAAVLGFYFVHTPVGSNISRLAMLAGAPAVLATARTRALIAVVLSGAVVWWPAKQVVEDVWVSRDASADAAYYRPLEARLAELDELRSQRLEVVEPRTHWHAYHLIDDAVLARGWNRQLDEELNPLFYGRAPLTATSYRQWLDQHAVSHVAVPDARLDFGSADEASLVGGGLPYLSEIWRDEHWTLYAVSDPAPLADGIATSAQWDGNGVRVTADRPGASVVRVRWSPFLAVDGVESCVTRAGEWTRVQFDQPGTADIDPRWSASGGSEPRHCAAGGSPRVPR